MAQREGKRRPDALSRNPVFDPQPHDTLAEFDTGNNPEMSIAELRAIANNSQENIQLQDLRRCAEHDHEYQKLRASFSMASPTIANSFQKNANDTGVFASTSQWMRTSSSMDAAC